MSKHIFYIGIGTNLDSSDHVLRWTKCRLCETFGEEIRFSTPCRTEPIDFPNPRPFTNQVALVEADISTDAISPLLKSLEHLFGREPEDKAKGIVKIDLDLLCLDGQVMKADDWERDYIIQAVAELY